ncbi:DUF2231 domain-containing protein [Paraburkholderia sp. MMS20-SJTR3]|uniref:DUF2231 domain-containing protein n=1 Tax=Paraburkholderia sejongensis TaxID=2886946 RepID=A0ABS8JUW7_9BURK|nr:DUF2231 domain-containing protein [Paraburkholderia sp. MMS20-SJTR3]MCC8393519.1 DUF2231 domain-containing protein [Paraburkholderia sp. MMS20-SJTR3]
MAKQDNSETGSTEKSEVLLELLRLDKGSAVALVGHPIHVMMVHFPIAFVVATLGVDVLYWWTGDPFWVRAGVWAAGFAFWSGVGASVVGTAELLLVRGIRLKEASWSHAVAAMTLVALAGANWGVRILYPEQILPHGLVLSLLASVMTGFAGWHGGKLVFDHGVGILVSPKE